jgi:hypothetical protein
MKGGAQKTMTRSTREEPLFELGQVVATPAFLEAISQTDEDLLTFLARHVVGDWGDVGPLDRRANEWAVRNGARILSVYELENGIRVWIITGADRKETTALLPSDY